MSKYHHSIYYTSLYFEYVHTCNNLRIIYNYITKTIKNINNKIYKYSYK